MPAPVPVRSNNHVIQRTPKAKRPRPVDGEEGSRKGKTPRAKPPPTGGEESSRKKRTPKAKRPPPVEGENGERSKKRRKTGKASGANVRGLGDNQNTPQAQSLAQAQPNSAVDKTSFTGFLNVPPAEAERRRQTAIELLTGRGIDPTTLSPEQFNIFANQAPNLQSASLDMLAKYGAERLRIVHPDEKEQAGSSNSTSTPTTEQTANPPLAVAPEPSSESTNTPTKKPRNKKRKSNGPLTEVPIGNGAVVPMEQDGGLGTTESALKPRTGRVRKTRGRCDTCKQRNVTVSHQSNKPLSEYTLIIILHSARKSILAAPSVLMPELIAFICPPSREESQKNRQKRLNRKTPISQKTMTVFSTKQTIQGRRRCRTRQNHRPLYYPSRLQISRTRNLYLIQIFCRDRSSIRLLLSLEVLVITINIRTVESASYNYRALKKQQRQ